MSLLQFPTLAGVDVKVERSPDWEWQIDQSLSRKEARSSYETYAVRKYKLTVNFMRSATQYSELQRLVSFWKQHAGQGDSWLVVDPEDNAVSGHGFGIGDGTTTAFQLQRREVSTVYDNLGGPSLTSSLPRTNLCIFSEQFDNGTGWTPSGTTTNVVPNVTTAPDGNGTADKLCEGANTSVHSIVSAVFAATPALTYTHSVFAKAAERTVIGIGNGTLSSFASFDLSAGTVQSATACTAAITACGNGWYRCAITFTQSPILALQGVNVGVNGFTSYTGDGVSGVYVWGAQAEQSTGATQYIPTTSTPLTVSPAFWPQFTDGFAPVSDLQGAPSIFLSDWQGTHQLFNFARTNFCFQSQGFSNATWTKTTATVGGAVAAPDGTTTAFPVTATAGGATVSQSIAGLTAGRQYTVSVWLKCTAGTTLKIGTTEGTGTSQTLNSTWQRFSFTFIAASTSTTFTIGAGASWVNAKVIQLWGAQLEWGTSATSYIATTTTAVAFTDYAISGTALVTFAAAPLAGAVLSWSGNYFTRVRFADANLPQTRIVNQVWSASFSLQEIKAVT